MDWLQFTSSLIGSLAWPITALIIVIVFRRPIGRILAQVRKFGAAGVNVELAEEVEAAKEAAETVEVERGQAATDITTLDPVLLELANKFPEAAFLQAYKEVEAVLLQIRAKLPGKPTRTLQEVMRSLLDKGYISGSIVALFQSLRHARNAAVHAPDDQKLSPSGAIELIRQLKLLQQLLMDVYTKLPQPSDRI